MECQGRGPAGIGAIPLHFKKLPDFLFQKSALPEIVVKFDDPAVQQLAKIYHASKCSCNTDRCFVYFHERCTTELETFFHRR